MPTRRIVQRVFQPGTLFCYTKYGSPAPTQALGFVVAWEKTPKNEKTTYNRYKFRFETIKTPEDHVALTLSNGKIIKRCWSWFDRPDINILAGENTEVYLTQWET